MGLKFDHDSEKWEKYLEELKKKEEEIKKDFLNSIYESLLHYYTPQKTKTTITPWFLKDFWKMSFRKFRCFTKVY